MDERVWSSANLLNVLQALRHPASEWAFFRELANGTGAHKTRTIDAWAIHLWPSKGFRAVGYEVKVSRSDFARELADPSKRGACEAISGECWFLTPAGLVRPDEVPEGWGLVEARDDGTLVNRKLPTQHPPPEPTIALLAAVARRSADPAVDPVVARLLGRDLRLEDLRRLVVASDTRLRGGAAVRGSPPARTWGDPDDTTTTATRRERLAWIEGELQAALGWGATRSREELRERLAAVAGASAAGALGPKLERARTAVTQLGDWLGLEVRSRQVTP